jgi:multicomponent Na+:H+ antiporter subunit E
VSRVLTVAWLAFAWVLLWGTYTPLTIAGGVLVGLGVTALFPAGPPDRVLPLRPLPLLGLLGFLARDVVVSSLHVTRETILRGPASRGAILELPLLSTSDRVVALLCNAYTLSPGTLVLQVDHVRSRWYIYVLGPRGEAGVERARRQALEVQRRVLAAVGSPEEIARAGVGS